MVKSWSKKLYSAVTICNSHRRKKLLYINMFRLSPSIMINKGKVYFLLVDIQGNYGEERKGICWFCCYTKKGEVKRERAVCTS